MPSEFREQSALIKWCHNHADEYEDLDRIFAVPNGGKRDKITAMNLKREGVKKGVPDLCLPKPIGKYHGAYIEMKQRKGGTLSPEQKDWINYLKRVGYCVERCDGGKEAMEFIKNYYLNR